MIEKIILDYLATVFEGVPVYMEVPESNKNPNSVCGRGNKFIVIQKTGSSLSNKAIASATIAIQSYGPSLLEAAQLNSDVIEAMLSIVSENDITNCSLNSDYEFTDPAKKQPRYQAVFDLGYYI